MEQGSEGPVFYVAPFGADGESVGVARYGLNDLSPRWLDLARRVLAGTGGAQRAALPTPLERLSLRLSTAAGAAQATFQVNGRAVLTAVYLRGEAPAAEKELLDSFVASLQSSSAAQPAWASGEPFSGMFGVAERPLHVPVPLNAPEVPEEDHQLVQQLATHVAGAFLLG